MKWLVAALAAALPLVMTACGDDGRGFEGTPNPLFHYDEILDEAVIVVFADTVSMDDAENPTTITIRPLATLYGQLPLDDAGEYTFDAPDQELSGRGRGFWMFRSDGAPLVLRMGDVESHRYPWPSQKRSVVFERFPAEVRASEVLDASDIVVLGAVPDGTYERGDRTITIDVELVLKGDPGPSRHLVVEIGAVEIIEVQDRCVYLIDETPDGTLELHDTWLAMGWAWDEPVLGDALSAAFPDVVPPHPYDC